MRSKQYIQAFGPSIAWALFILLGSLLPSNRMPSAGMSDKVIHSIIYFVLALFLSLGLAKQLIWPRIRKHSGFISVGIAIVYGLIMEVCQMAFIPSRSGEWLDVLANIGGALLVLPVFKIIVGNVFD